MAEAQAAQAQANEQLAAAQAVFAQEQAEAVGASEAVTAAAAAATQAKGTLIDALADFQEATAEAQRIVEENASLVGDREAVAEAEAAEEQALADVGEAKVQADEAIDAYEEAADTLYTENEQAIAAADAVTAADSAAQAAAATTAAYEAGYADATANKRVSPVAQGSYTTSAVYGQSGSWSKGYHTGQDYAAPTGTAVVAAGSGTVVSVGYDGSYGNRVVIQHENGYRSTYNHLSSMSVSVGQSVSAGDRVGAVGNTGNSTGPHLHFEVTQGGDGWSGGSFVNPNQWLAGEIG